MVCDCNYLLPKESVQEEHYDTCRSKWEKENPGKTLLRNEDGSLRLSNKHLKNLDVDFLYHLNLNTLDHDLPSMFGDVKFVITGGTEHRMKEFASYIAKLLGLRTELENLTVTSHRYAMFKVGPVLCFNHGIGIPSMITAMQEVFKLLHYAKAKDPIFIRLGTCGGVGVEAGSVVVSSWGLNGIFEKSFNTMILGEIRRFPSYLDKRLAQEISSMSLKEDGFPTYIGGTFAADDFYRGQGRLDGPFCDYSEEDKMAFLRKLENMGVRNIEMEATAFSALCNEAGIRAAIVCVAFLNRLNGDQVTTPKDKLKTLENHPMILVGRFIESCVKNQKKYKL